MTLRLRAAIDSDTAAAGDPLDATLMAAVRDPKSDAVLFPAGTVVHGRITRMEYWLVPAPRFVIGIHWDSFAAIPDRSGTMSRTALPSRGVTALQQRAVPLGAPDALTIHTDEKRYVVPAGLEMRWVTVAP
jgi:hypothetical protein